MEEYCKIKAPPDLPKGEEFASASLKKEDIWIIR
jgi:hypothetical protein